MLSFLEDDEEYDTITMANKLNGKIQQVAFLSQQMHALNGKLQVDPRYVKQTMQPPSKDKSKGGRPRSAVDGMDDDDYEMVAAMQASLQTM